MASLARLGGFFQGLASGIQDSQRIRHEKELLRLQKEETENRRRLLDAQLTKMNQEIASSERRETMGTVTMLSSLYDQRIDAASMRYEQSAQALQALQARGALGSEGEVTRLQGEITSARDEVNHLMSEKSALLSGLLAATPEAPQTKAAGQALGSLTALGETFQGGVSSDTGLPGMLPRRAPPADRETTMAQPAQEPATGGVAPEVSLDAVLAKTILSGRGDVEIVPPITAGGEITIVVDDPEVEKSRTLGTAETTRGEQSTTATGESGRVGRVAGQRESLVLERSMSGLQSAKDALVKNGWPVDPRTNELQGVRVVARSEYRAITDEGAAEKGMEIANLVQTEVANISGVHKEKGLPVFFDEEAGAFRADAAQLNDHDVALASGVALLTSLDKLDDRGEFDISAVNAVAPAAFQVMESIQNNAINRKTLVDMPDGNLVPDPYAEDISETLAVLSGLQGIVGMAAKGRAQEPTFLLRSVSPEEGGRFLAEHLAQIDKLVLGKGVQQGVGVGQALEAEDSAVSALSVILSKAEVQLQDDATQISDATREALVDQLTNLFKRLKPQHQEKVRDQIVRVRAMLQ